MSRYTVTRSGVNLREKPAHRALKRTEPWLQHHEPMDGSGYPAGLSGDDILPEARILGVADVVEAMCSHRPYRPAVGVAAALLETRSQRSSLYDPEVVDACVRPNEKGFA